MPKIDCIRCNIEFERDFSKLTIGETYRIRLITNKIHPDDYQIRFAGGIAGKTVNDNHYNFLIIPNEVGKVNIGVYLSIDFITEYPTVNICNFEYEAVH